MTRLAVERGRDGQRIVDERAVEAVVPGVELHVEPQRIGDVAHDRVARHGSGREHRVLAARRARASRPACCRRGGPAGRRRSGRIRACSVTSRPSASGRGIVGIGLARRGPGAEDDLRRLGVAVDVPLGRRGRVARDAERPAHQRVALEQAGERRLAQDREGEIRERAERHERDLARPPARLVEDDVDGVTVRDRRGRRRQHRVTQALRPVRLGGRLERPDERDLASRARPRCRCGRPAPGSLAC